MPSILARVLVAAAPHALLRLSLAVRAFDSLRPDEAGSSVTELDAATALANDGRDTGLQHKVYKVSFRNPRPHSDTEKIIEGYYSGNSLDGLFRKVGRDPTPKDPSPLDAHSEATLLRTLLFIEGSWTLNAGLDESHHVTYYRTGFASLASLRCSTGDCERVESFAKALPIDAWYDCTAASDCKDADGEYVVKEDLQIEDWTGKMFTSKDNTKVSVEGGTLFDGDYFGRSLDLAFTRYAEGSNQKDPVVTGLLYFEKVNEEVAALDTSKSQLDQLNTLDKKTTDGWSHGCWVFTSNQIRLHTKLLDSRLALLTSGDALGWLQGGRGCEASRNTSPAKITPKVTISRL